MVLRTWRCTAGHVALTVLEHEDRQHDYSPKCVEPGCTLPVAEREPQRRTEEGDQP